MEINQIQQAISVANFRITDHAHEEMVADALALDEVLQSVLTGEVIEDYPTDYPLPSCLILGFLDQVDPVHSAWAYNSQTKRAVLITVYRPDPNRWVNWRTRKP
jgi:hypothetical protein